MEEMSRNCVDAASEATDASPGLVKAGRFVPQKNEFVARLVRDDVATGEQLANASI
jgi:hypothetical protein